MNIRLVEQLQKLAEDEENIFDIDYKFPLVPSPSTSLFEEDLFPEASKEELEQRKSEKQRRDEAEFKKWLVTYIPRVQKACAKVGAKILHLPDEKDVNSMRATSVLVYKVFRRSWNVGNCYTREKAEKLVEAVKAYTVENWREIDYSINEEHDYIFPDDVNMILGEKSYWE